MPDYEVTFRTEALSDEQEAWILDELEGFVGGHGDVTLVTLAVSAESGKDAGMALSRTLIDGGVGVVGVHSDLVTRAVIAERCDATRQAVGNWIRGDRQASAPFPAPINLVGGGVWRWPEVNEWLRLQGKRHDADVTYLSRDDEVMVDHGLLCSITGAARSAP